MCVAESPMTLRTTSKSRKQSFVNVLLLTSVPAYFLCSTILKQSGVYHQIIGEISNLAYLYLYNKKTTHPLSQIP